jgi:hypothetical protein
MRKNAGNDPALMNTDESRLRQIDYPRLYALIDGPLAFSEAC